MMMKAEDLKKLGIPPGPAHPLAFSLIAQYGIAEAEGLITAVGDSPELYKDDPVTGELARAVIATPVYKRTTPAVLNQWGSGIDPKAVEQMQVACDLPVAVYGALMPDAHLGYGLPIGGVLAVDNAVIPYAVGVDIACRMKLSVLSESDPEASLEHESQLLRDAINLHTRFGVGCEFNPRQDHDVMDMDWSVSPVTQANKDKAWAQLGTSGSGNHFVEFGILTLSENQAHALNLSAGKFLALLSHSGSRGAGAAVCNHYSKLALAAHPHIPHEMRHLAWLGLDTQEGQEYWAAMELMGAYASANHDLIHRNIAQELGMGALLSIENHHNFAWKEQHFGRELIVHRKGATPAHAGVLGVIPGTMADEAYIVQGLGNTHSLCSASHGAGRAMSRKQASQSFTWEQTNAYLKERKVELLSAGLDESPMAYKNIHQVMSDQQGQLVKTLGLFQPRMVKMAPAGERPED